MNPKFYGLIAGVSIIALSSCSVYKSGQTPDDVYYSPSKTLAPVASAKNDQEYVETNNKRKYNSSENYDDANYRDDQYLRMMIGSGRRNYYYNDFAMADPYLYNNWRWNSYMTWNSGFGSPWNSMYYWNSFYNPYYGHSYYSPYYSPVYTIPGKGTNFFTSPSRPSSAFSMGSYLNTNGTRNSSGFKPGRYYGGSYSNTNGNRRPLFNENSNNRNSNNSSYERPTRSYTPSSNSGSSNRSSSPSSGSSGGGVSRPTRTGN
jgi:hypothetical protein